MILYRHTPNKAPLLDGVAETVLSQLRVDSAGPDWAGQLREVARRFRALAQRGLDILLTGLSTTLSPPGQARPH